MKPSFLLSSSFLIISFLCSFASMGQTKPLILKGKIDNYGGDEVYLGLKTRSGETMFDTIKLKRDGSFFYKTYKCIFPQDAFFGSLGANVGSILVAPGYVMTITCDAKDYTTLLASRNITGTGSCVNRYRKKMDELFFSGVDSMGHEHSLTNDTSGVIPRLTKHVFLQDSISNVVFGHCKEPYALFFKRLEHYTNLFSAYSTILEIAEFGHFDDTAYFGFINGHIPKEILENPGKDSFLIANNYIFFIGDYLKYMKQKSVRQQKKPVEDETEFDLKSISQSFNGRVREVVLYSRYNFAIRGSKSMEQLISRKKQFYPYIRLYVTADKRAQLEDLYSDKYKYFNAVKPGMPAPVFVLQDDHGTTHSLSEYKGKVVYIDFWASSCGPCRLEAPSFKKLSLKYKTDERIQLMSIAVFDAKENWLKAIRQDGMDWLQLRDDKDKLKDDYNTGTISRFVIIDKQGKIVTLDAPRPSQEAVLTQILEKQLNL